MTIASELRSVFVTPKNPPTQPAPQPGDHAPETKILALPAHQPSIVAFLRHCGCPFSELTFQSLRRTAAAHPNIHFVAVSHSDQAATDIWHSSLPEPTGGAEPANLTVVVDADREAYAAWGLGVSGVAHVVNWTSLTRVLKLTTAAGGGIAARHTRSGSRWQTSGTYAVDAEGIVRWGAPALRADDVPDLDAAVKALEVKEG